MRRTLSAVAIALFAAALSLSAEELTPSGRNLAAPAQLEEIEFFLGEWAVFRRSAPDGPPVGRMSARYILDGFAIQADYHGLGPGGEVAFRGTSIRTWDPLSEHFIMHWAVASTAEYTLIRAQKDGDDLVSTGEGRDWRGADFIERYRFSKIEEDQFQFEMERSFDEGSTWIQLADVVYRRQS